MLADPEMLIAVQDAAARQTRRHNLQYLIHVDEVSPEVKRYAAECWLDEGFTEEES